MPVTVISKRTRKVRIINDATSGFYSPSDRSNCRVAATTHNHLSGAAGRRAPGFFPRTAGKRYLKRIATTWS